MAKKVADDQYRAARAKRISEICGRINKTDFGGENHDAVTWLGSRDAIVVERFPSGCAELDEALGGGWPRGRFIELGGPESGGKTTTALHALAEHQKAFPDEDVAFIDVEYSYDDDYAAAIGVNTEFLIVSQPDNGEQALNVLEQLILMGVKCIVVDSVAALSTKAEIEGEMGDQQMGEQARLMSKAMRKLTAISSKRKSTVFFTNQVREKIGVMFGDKTTTPGGRALRHFASVRVSISRTGMGEKEVVNGEEIILSSKVSADIKKNKCAPPFRKAEFFITFGHGFDRAAALLDNAIKHKVISKKGSWLALGAELIGQGRALVLDKLRTQPEFWNKIEQALANSKNDPKEDSPAVVEKDGAIDITATEVAPGMEPAAGKLKRTWKRRAVSQEGLDKMKEDGAADALSADAPALPMPGEDETSAETLEVPSTTDVTDA